MLLAVPAALRVILQWRLARTVRAFCRPRPWPLFLTPAFPHRLTPCAPPPPAPDCCSCCIPVLIASIIPATQGFLCCIWSGDRNTLAQRYGVLDPHAGSACCLFCLGCSTCLLAQELNHIASQRGKMGQGSTVVVTQAMPQQQVMGVGYPGGGYPPQQQPGYAPGYPVRRRAKQAPLTPRALTPLILHPLTHSLVQPQPMQPQPMQGYPQQQFQPGYPPQQPGYPPQ